MRILLLILVAIVLVATTVHAQEVLTLDTPESQSQPDRTAWNVKEIHFLFEVGPANNENRITIQVQDNNGILLRCEWRGDTAHADMIVLNKANLSSNSLEKRTLSRLLTVGGSDAEDVDGGPCLPAGTVTGTPQ